MKLHGQTTGARLLAIILSMVMLCSVVSPALADGLTESLVEPIGMPSASTMKYDGAFYSDFNSFEEERIAAAEINRQIGEEGMVLLKNENNALPLRNGAKVTLFGYRSVRIMTGGGGSGMANIGVYGVPETTLYSSLVDAGFRVNNAVYHAYETYNQRIGVEDGLFGSSGSEAAVEDVLTKSIQATYPEFGDAALIVVSRAGLEGSDFATHDATGCADTTKHALELNDNEIALVQHVKANFDKVILLVNTGNTMELGELNDVKTADNLGVDAILYIGHVGNDAAAAIGKILNGSVNPSGHTADTWVRDFTKDPTWTNFGDMIQNGTDNNFYFNGEATNYHAVEYREDIYMGNRYWETVAADMNAAEPGSGDAWYSENVVYPFGYGLSYTTFDWELAEDVASEAVIEAPNSTVTIKVKVTNTGSVAGKDVVQIYFSAPYTKGGIEKADHTLVAFAKTDLLAPGESQTVSCQFVAQDMASFDWNDANGNDFVGYELEAGDYIISARSDAHTEKLSVKRTVQEGIQCETDYTTGKEITAVFSQEEDDRWGAYNSTNETLLSNLMTRDSDMAQPAPATVEDRTIDDDLMAFLENRKEDFAYEDDNDGEGVWKVTSLPETWTQAVAHEDDYSDVTIKLADMIGVPYTNASFDPDSGEVTAAEDEGSRKWDEFMNQLTYDELVLLAEDGNHGRPAIPSIGKPEESDFDGPAQIGCMMGNILGMIFNAHGAKDMGTAWAGAVLIASTWNQDLAYEQGRMVGNESLYTNISGWYGPAMNLHRSQFGGRNFEYYSEDGMLSALIAASVVRGATDKGTVCYLKHLVLNDQETNRDTMRGISTFVTEQAIREIYLKPFEYSIKVGGALGTMNSNNRIGNWCGYTNGALHDGLLHEEWNFQGITLTDGWSNQEYNRINTNIRNGVDLPLGDGIGTLEKGIWNPDLNCVMMQTETEMKTGADTYSIESYTQYYHLRRAALHLLYVTANSNGMNNAIRSTADVTANMVLVQMPFAPAPQKQFELNNSSLASLLGALYLSNVEVAQGSELPAGVSVSADGQIAVDANAAVPGNYSITLNVQGDGWSWMTVTMNMEILDSTTAE